MLDHLKQRALNALRRDVYYVTDRGQWSFYWDAHYITQGLKAHHVRAHIVHDAWRLRNQIIQFGDRYAYLSGPFTTIHPSNNVYLTWFHGNRDDPNPDVQILFERLPDALPHLRGIVVPCQISYDVLRDFGVEADKLTIIPLGVDLAQFTPPSEDMRRATRQELGIPDDAFCIGSFQKDGRGWDGAGLESKPVKGPDVFLEVVAELAKEANNLMVLLSGPARGFVKQGLDKIGVPYVHHFLQDYRQIVRLYHALDAYLITSRAEGGPKGFMESWATGVPVVSTRMGMPADWIRHGENGLLADSENVMGLADSMRRLMDDAGLRTRICEQATSDVQALSWGAVADQYYALYKPVLG
jgi:glycosyltransferase involved in cell wall biosynthesis